MSETRADLQARLDAAVEALDFETAATLRDQLSLTAADANADADAGALDTSRMTRQQPGRMGLGTSEPTRVRPPGWVPPKKPDPMTTTVRGRKGPRR